MRFLIMLLAVSLSGCATQTEPQTPDVVEAPDDYSYLQEPSPAGHMHNYWGGRDRIQLMDTTYGAQNGPVYNGEMKVYQKLPDLAGGVIVPQGTGRLEILVDLKSSAASMYRNGEVVAYTPADDELRVLGPVGTTFRYNVSAAEADLPHSQISGWEFWMRFDGENGVYLLAGSIDVSIEAFRGGEPLPVFPNHPDLWKNRSEFPLFSRSIDARYLHYGPVVDGCSGIGGCTGDINPDPGVIVPPGADHIDVVVRSVGTTPMAMTLTYHGADSYEFRQAELIDESDGRTYRIQVGTRGDSPYAETSLWEFRLRPDNNLAVGEVEVTATVYRYLEPGPDPL